MKKYSLRVTDVAEERSYRIHDWWRENRSASPDLFLEELKQALSLISMMPAIGRPYRGVRRLLLTRTRYFVYYVIDEQAQAIEVRTIDHASARFGPLL